MTFKPKIWYPIAVALSVINLGGVAFAVGPVEPWHATIHAVLALGFGLWAQRLRQGPGGRGSQAALEAPEPSPALEALEAEVSRQQQELSDMQERLDFAERLLAQGRETRRAGPQP